MNNPVIMHCNFMEQGQTLSEMCRKAADLGFDGVEFRRKRIGITEDPDFYLESLAKAVEDAGLKTVIFGYPTANLMLEDADARKREVDDACSFYRKASKMFKLTVCNAFCGTLISPSMEYIVGTYEDHGSAIANEEHFQWATEGYKVLGALAEELGFRFAFEMHMGYIHDNPTSMMKLVRSIDSPAVGVNLDYGNVVYYKGAPSAKDAVETVKDKLYYVHLKNSAGPAPGVRFGTALGEGEIDHREYLTHLKKIGYSGPLCVEASRPGDREHHVSGDLAYLRELMAVI